MIETLALPDPLIGFVITPPLTVAFPALSTSELIVAFVALKLPPDWATVLADPPVRLAVPPEIATLPRVPFELSDPEPEMVVRPPIAPVLLIDVVPPERLAKPVILDTLATDPPVCVRFDTVPPVRLAVPLLTVMPASVAFDVSVPAVTVVAPFTVPPVSLVVPVEPIEARVPPVMFKAPALVVAPTVPADMLAVPSD